MSFFKQIFAGKSQKEQIADTIYDSLRKCALEVYKKEGDHMMTGALIQASVVELAESLKKSYTLRSKELGLSRDEIDKITHNACKKILSQILE